MVRAQTKELTADRIKKASREGTPYWMTDASGPRGGGRLLVLIAKNGNKLFYYRYAPANGKRASMPLGPFSYESKPGFLTLKEARAKVLQLGALNRADESRDVRKFLDDREAAKREADEAAVRRIEAEREAAEAASAYTLRALCAEYVAHLERRPDAGRTAYDARNIFKNHVVGDPKQNIAGAVVADRPARDVERGEIAALVRKLVEADKGRTAGKLRSYLRAAYAMAMRAEGDASVPAAFIAFKVTDNPVADTQALPQFTRARDRTLDDAELWAYWTRLGGVPDAAQRSALQLALLLGGQRIAQLLRLTRADVDLAAGFLILRDPKGKRAQPRVHELPITPTAAAILAPVVDAAAAAETQWVFTSNGKTPDPTTLTHLVRSIAAAMKKAKESKSPFQLSDIRRTAETMMARMGVSQDVRAHIQSHGLSGVQHKHYNTHPYRDEKRKVLTTWARR